MKPKKKLLKKSRLYLIIDSQIAKPAGLGRIAKKLRQAPIDIIQLRDKHSKKRVILKEALALRGIFLNSAKLFLVNDYPDIAKICHADGVHLGQGDLPVKAARRMLGSQSIIGKSCHNLRQAMQAEKEGVDYIGMGPLFASRTKRLRRKMIEPALIRAVSRKINIPLFAVGGITANNLGQAFSLGIRRVAVCGAILRANNAALAAKDFNRQLKELNSDDLTGTGKE
ncbi:MAG: thiamine phosphate synthase [Candidatus Omnitrophota bacterium]